MYVHIYIYCRASHTSEAIRVMYSSVSVGVVHVLGACAQVQSTVWCAFHTAACNTSFCHIFVILLLVVVVLLLLVVVVVLATHLISAFLWALGAGSGSTRFRRRFRRFRRMSGRLWCKAKSGSTGFRRRFWRRFRWRSGRLWCKARSGSTVPNVAFWAKKKLASNASSKF